MTKAAPISPLLERAARALNQVDWRYYMHQDDNAARKRRRTASIRNARNVFKALRRFTSDQHDAVSNTGKMWRDLSSQEVWEAIIASALSEPPVLRAPPSPVDPHADPSDVPLPQV